MTIHTKQVTKQSFLFLPFLYPSSTLDPTILSPSSFLLSNRL